MKKINRRTFIRNSALAGMALSHGLYAGCQKNPSPSPVINQSISRQPYNIVIIAVDTLRADHLGCYGYPRNTSPNIDRFFSENRFQFFNAISPCGWTVPSFASLFTGQHPLVHGVFDASKRLPESAITIQDLLKEAGYRSGFFMQDIYLAADTMLGFAQGADEFFSSRSRYDEGLYTDVCNWLKGTGEKPFFLFVHTFDNHMPWLPPRPFNKEFIFDEYYQTREIPVVTAKSIYTDVKGTKNMGILRKMYRKMGHINDEGYYRALYDASLKYSDHQIERIIQMLSEAGAMERTVFILTSDHGENLGEHNHIGHHFFYEPIERIPLLIKIPAAQSRDIASPILLEDLPATLLDLAGLPDQPGMNGISYLPVMTGEQRSIRNFACVTGSFWGMVRGEVDGQLWKLVIAEEGYSDERMDQNYLFNLSTDPKEEINLYSDREEIVAILSQVFFEWKSNLEKTETTQDGGISEEMMKSLKALGYMGNGS